jgi:ABC-type Fe3+-hydroxamate transport system substrate-binding protein
MFLRDARGREFAPLGAGPLRLVSLVPSTTETLFALGRGADLVGYTRFCVHPEGEVSAERWIGGTKNPRTTRIVELRPDLVLANREENRPEDVATLEAAGIPVWVAEPRTVTDAIADLRAMGTLLGRHEQGEALALQVEQALAEARAYAPTEPRTYAYLIWRDPWLVAGQETFISDLLAQGGGHNPFTGRYPEVTLDELHDVERVLLASEPFPFAEQHREELLAAGFAPEQVRLVDGERLSWHGVRLLRGLPYLREALQ